MNTRPRHSSFRKRLPSSAARAPSSANTMITSLKASLRRPPALGLTITIRGGNKVLMSAARIPPGPKAHFLLGNLPEYRRDPLSFLSMCARDYGDVVLIRVAHLKAYILNHPDYIEEVLVTKNRSFIKDRTLRRRPFRLFFGNGLLTSEGDQWLRERRL